MFLISYVPKHKLKSYVKKIMIYKINDIYYTYIPMLTKHNTIMFYYRNARFMNWLELNVSKPRSLSYIFFNKPKHNAI
jgi:hypothetical protein